MPIYEYICRKCEHHFEVLVQGSANTECPSCKGKKLEKQLSVFAAGNNSGARTESVARGACGTCGDPRGPGSCSMN